MLDTFVALDFETTGFNASTCRVVEIGAVKVMNGVIVDRFETLVKVEKSEWCWRAAKKHGIRHHQTIGAPSPAIAFKLLHDFIGLSTIVAHNADFEKQFLASELKRIGLSIPDSFECSLKSAKNKISKQQVSNYQLSTISDHFSIAPEGSLHRALPDALLCAKVWLELENTPNSYFGKHNKKSSAFSATPISNNCGTSPDLEITAASYGKSKSKDISDLNFKAWRFEHGDGVDVDMEMSIMLYREAAELGSAYAIHKLGEFYMHGEWLAKDLDMAQYWFEIGFKQHPAESIFASRLAELKHYNSAGSDLSSILASTAKAQIHIAKTL